MSITTRQLDEQFESFLDSIVIDDSKSELTSEQRIERRKLADNDELAFCTIYYPQIFSQPFNKMHESIRDMGTGKHTRSGARLIGKSAYAYVAKVVKPMAIGNGGLLGVCMRTLEKGSIERTAALIRLIKKNPKLMYDYNINIQQDRKGYYIVNNTTLIALSVDTQLRSLLDEEFKRFTFILGDDLYSKNTVRSENDNEKVTDFVLSEIDGQLEPDGTRLILGNSIN